MAEWYPWAQQDGEPGPAWQAFVTYRDLGPSRSLRKAAETLQPKPKHPTTLSEWSRKWEWDARVRAWDAEVDRQRRAKFLDLQMRVVERQVRDATVLRKVALKSLKGMTKRVRPATAGRFLQIASKIERAALGLPDGSLPPNDDTRTPADHYFDSMDKVKLLEQYETAITVIKSDLQPEESQDAEPAKPKRGRPRRSKPSE